MTVKRIAAAGAVLALATGCYGRKEDGEKPSATLAAAKGDCPAIAPAKPPGEIRRNTTLIDQPLKVPAPPLPLQVVVNVKCLDAKFLIPRHKHPWQRYVYIESGSVVVTFEDPVPQQISFKAGDLITESIDTWHTAQIGDAPAKLIVIDQVPTTNPPTNNQINPPGP